MIKIVELNSVQPTKNKYDFLSEVTDKYGIYLFFESETGTIFYIGETRDQSLKKRCTQNFTEKDTGGTFRNNYMMMENKTFFEFIEQVKKLKILFIASDSKSMAIRALESVLILLLKPKYNKDK